MTAPNSEPDQTNNALVVDELTIVYPGAAQVSPIKGFSTSVRAATMAAVLGPSGCGKTSLLSCLAGLLRPAAGSVTVGGQRVSELEGASLDEYRRSTIGIVFQAFNLIPSLTAIENVMLPLRARGQRAVPARIHAASVLERVGLVDRANHRPAELSGGQMQRVAIARAIATDPPFVIADEPTANLDQDHVAAIISLLASLTNSGTTVVVATHDQRVVEAANHVIDLTPR